MNYSLLAAIASHLNLAVLEALQETILTLPVRGRLWAAAAVAQFDNQQARALLGQVAATDFDAAVRQSAKEALSALDRSGQGNMYLPIRCSGRSWESLKREIRAVSLFEPETPGHPGQPDLDLGSEGP